MPSEGPHPWKSCFGIVYKIEWRRNRVATTHSHKIPHTFCCRRLKKKINLSFILRSKQNLLKSPLYMCIMENLPNRRNIKLNIRCRKTKCCLFSRTKIVDWPTFIPNQKSRCRCARIWKEITWYGRFVPCWYLDTCALPKNMPLAFLQRNIMQTNKY